MGRRPKELRDPNKPKHPTCAWIYFLKDHKASPRDGARLSEVYRAMTVEQRRPYEEKAVADRVRYDEEMREYNKKLAEQNFQDLLNNPQVNPITGDPLQQHAAQPKPRKKRQTMDQVIQKFQERLLMKAGSPGGLNLSDAMFPNLSASQAGGLTPNPQATPTAQAWAEPVLTTAPNPPQMQYFTSTTALLQNIVDSIAQNSKIQQNANFMVPAGSVSLLPNKVQAFQPETSSAATAYLQENRGAPTPGSSTTECPLPASTPEEPMAGHNQEREWTRVTHVKTEFPVYEVSDNEEDDDRRLNDAEMLAMIKAKEMLYKNQDKHSMANRLGKFRFKILELLAYFNEHKCSEEDVLKKALQEIKREDFDEFFMVQKDFINLMDEVKERKARSNREN